MLLHLIVLLLLLLLMLLMLLLVLLLLLLLLRRCANGHRFGGRLQDVTILGHHQHADEVDDGQRQELRLLCLLLE